MQTIITTENTASRASVGLFSPWSMSEAMIATSIVVTAIVITSVPNGSPSRAATPSP